MALPTTRYGKPFLNGDVARGPGEAEHPELWNGLVGCWLPGIREDYQNLMIKNWASPQGHSQSHGTLANMSPASDWVVSQRGWSLDFDGSNDQVSGSIAVADSPITIYTHFRTPSSGTARPFNLCDVSVLKEYIGIDANVGSDFSYWYRDNTTDSEMIIAGSPAANTWYHCAAVSKANNDHELFVDGESIGTSSTNEAPGDMDSFGIGFLNRSSPVYSQCRVSLTMVWQRAVPPAIIKRLAYDPHYHPLTRKRRLQAFFTVSGGTTVNVGLASETDTALAAGSAKTKALGQAVETDTARPVTSPAVMALGIASETDTALPVSPAKAKTLGIASEVDTATEVLPVKNVYVAAGQAAETDTALPVSRAKAKTLGQAIETDTARPVTSTGAILVGQAAETDTAFSVSRAKVKSVGQATETDTARPVLRPAAVNLGQATETDAALPVSRSKVKTLGIASEVDESRPLGKSKAKAVGLAWETDSALPLNVPITGVDGRAVAGSVWKPGLMRGAAYKPGLRAGEVA